MGIWILLKLINPLVKGTFLIFSFMRKNEVTSDIISNRGVIISNLCGQTFLCLILKDTSRFSFSNSFGQNVKISIFSLKNLNLKHLDHRDAKNAKKRAKSFFANR